MHWFVLTPFLGDGPSAIRHVSRDETAFLNRNLRTVWELYANISDGTDLEPVTLVEFVSNLREDLLPVEAVCK